MTYPDRDAPTTQAVAGSPGHTYPSGSTGAVPGSTTGTGSGSTADAVKDQARETTETAGHAAKQVASTAKEQAGSVASEAGAQTKRMLQEAQQELNSQAGTQQQRAAGGLRSLGDELRSMADKGEQSGPATSVAHQAADRAASLADWLESREPGDVLNEVKRFARQRPGAFLALSAGAGLLAARFARGLTADSGSTGGTTASGAGRAPVTPTTPTRVADIPRTPVTGDPALATPPRPDLDPTLSTPIADAPYPASPDPDIRSGQGPVGGGRGVV